jgi:CHAT domain-containing protein
MFRRLYPRSDDPDLATALSNLAGVVSEQGKYADAESLYKDALDRYRRYYKTDHANVALVLNNLASAYQHQDKFAEAEPLFKESLDVFKRLHPRQDHPQIAGGLNNLALLYSLRGKDADAEPLLKEALDIYRRLYKDHQVIARCLNNLGGVYQNLGKHADADRSYREALAMQRRLVVAYAAQRSEGDALTLLASLPRLCDHFLLNAQLADAEPAALYSEVWATKGLVARVFESRQQAARAAATDPKAAALLRELTTARQARAELLLAPESRDPDTRTKRRNELRRLDALIAERHEQLRPLLPSLARTERLAAASPRDLQAALPADAAVIDFFRYGRVETGLPARIGKAQWRFLAFVVTRDGIACVDLNKATNIEDAVTAWRTAITTTDEEIPAETASKVRDLVWQKVHKELPGGIKTVYICPDAALCRVSWPALPGVRPDSILLEDYAVAVVPHGQFLLDKLWPADRRKDVPTSAIVVGGVQYDAQAGSAVKPGAPGNMPLVKPGPNLRWSVLPSTLGEANRVANAATQSQLAVSRFDGERATGAAILGALPQARYAHLATHGFFADPTFRSLLELDPKEFEQRGGERIGRAVNSPLVMTGLVFAGANDPKAAGRGIVTGEALVDLDLSGLELAVLSACETGLGEVAGGEGVFGLQRAFHLAGCRNVVASLWKVNDAATAALMTKFYHEMWVNKKPPIEALREAQRTIYRHPELIPALAGERGRRDRDKAVAVRPREPGVSATGDRRADTRLWAAFVLSGVGK